MLWAHFDLWLHLRRRAKKFIISHSTSPSWKSLLFRSKVAYQIFHSVLTEWYCYSKVCNSDPHCIWIPTLFTCTANWICSGPTVFGLDELLVDASCDVLEVDADSIGFLSGWASEMYDNKRSSLSVRTELRRMTEHESMPNSWPKGDASKVAQMPSSASYSDLRKLETLLWLRATLLPLRELENKFSRIRKANLLSWAKYPLCICWQSNTKIISEYRTF